MTARTHPLCAAVAGVVADSGLSWRAAAQQVSAVAGEPAVVSQQLLHLWGHKTVPTVDQVARVEAAFDLPRGELLRRSGYVAGDVRSTVRTIEVDDRLDKRDRETLVALYRVMVRRRRR